MSRGPFGLEVHPYYDSKTILDEIKLAEAMGYDDVWIGDSQLIWRELYVLMGAAAQTTSKVFLGSGVTNPITRLPAVTASAAVTLQELSGGRMMLGIGSGFSSVNTMGMKPATLKELEEFARDIFDAEGLNSKPDILPLLLKEWKAYEEKLLLEEKEKLNLQ